MSWCRIQCCVGGPSWAVCQRWQVAVNGAVRLYSRTFRFAFLNPVLSGKRRCSIGSTKRNWSIFKHVECALKSPRNDGDVETLESRIIRQGSVAEESKIKQKKPAILPAAFYIRGFLVKNIDHMQLGYLTTYLDVHKTLEISFDVFLYQLLKLCTSADASYIRRSTNVQQLKVLLRRCATGMIKVASINLGPPNVLQYWGWG